MIAVHFSKMAAERFAAAIGAGKPIQAPAEGWTGNQMLTLAGMLYAAVFSQGPHNYQVKGIDLDYFKGMHPELREAVEGDFNQDIHDGIEFVSNLFFQVIDGEYDQHCEQNVKGVIYHSEDGKKHFFPAEGFKAGE